MSETWVLVAESSRAKILAAATPKGSLRELEAMAHPEARLHEQELTSDRPGRTFDSAGQGRHAMGHKVSPKQQEAINFAKEIAERLESARTGGQFDKLVLVATPAFLGLLREHLSANTMKLVTEEIDKNLVSLDAAELRKQLPEKL